MAGGHLTPPDKDQAYSGVVSLQTMRLAILAGELNHLNIMVGDIGNAYLESYTNEKVVFTAGPKFKELEGHTLVIVKTLYGLRSSGARFHEALAHTLKKEGLFHLRRIPTYGCVLPVVVMSMCVCMWMTC